MTRMSLAEAKARFAEAVRATEHGERIVITRHGRPVAALVPVDELEQLERRGAGEPGGLATLAGGWEGSDELAERVADVTARRSRTRPLPRRR